MSASLANALARRELLIGGLGLVFGVPLAGCGKSRRRIVSRIPRFDRARLEREVGAIAARAAPGVLGFALMNLQSSESWDHLGDRAFPMQSVFKLALGAAVLSEVDAGRVKLAEAVTLTAEELSPPWSPIADAWPERTAYTIEELLVAAVADSDNTAADLLMKRIGGPGAVSAWLQSKNVMDVRVDRYEREIQPEVYGMASFRPAWKGDAAFSAAKATVAPAKRHAAMLAYMADPRDTATPRGMLGLLQRLDQGLLISQASRQRLLSIMRSARRGGDRLQAGLPNDASFAHKTGTSGTDQGLNAAFNDVGVFRLTDGRSYAIAAFLSGSTAPEKARGDLFADLARAAVRGIG